MTTKISQISLLFSMMMSLLAIVAHASMNNTNNNDKGMASEQSKATVAVKVGVILDLNGTDDLVGKVGLSCIEMAVSDFYDTHPNYTTRLVIHARNSPGDDLVQAAASGIDLIKNVQVRAILGPETSTQAHFIIGLGEKAQVPIISFSVSSPAIDASNRNPYFFRATPNDSTQVEAISAIVKHLGWRQVVPIYIDNDFGNGVIPYLVDSLESVNAHVPYRACIPPFATDDFIGEELYKLMTMQTRVFIVHMDPNMGTRLFAKAKEVGMTVDYVWIVTDGITTFLNSMDHSVLESMQGVIGIKPYVPETRQVKHFRGRWKKKFYQDHPEMMNVELNNYGLWAYDATTALARAVENIAGDLTNEEGIVSNISSTSTPDLERLGVFKSGRTLVHELSQTRLKGLSGDFVLEKGKQRDPTYQIVNIVNGDGERGIGFWSSHKDQLQLETVIWPGDTTKKPKGFEIPINGKRLKIGVPVKHGFFEFVNATDKNDIKGYCIDIFEAAVKALPYALPFDYVQFPSWIYNDIVHDVFSMNLDGAVGDITIRLNRSLYVDFTLPYTESGVAMLVPVEDTGNKNNAWVFLGPLTWNLWVTTFLFFIFIGFVIWVLEHRINNDFRGPPSHQAGTSFWFSFSTMVFAHREKVVSNLTRIVMIVWCFVVLILTQSYTASLTSRLTVQKLRPTITNINDVLRNGDSVGYQEGSFLHDLLTGLGFPRNKLLPYKNLTECESLFSQRKIAAAVDEVSYVKIFLAKHCSNYAMIDQPAHKIDGFAFAFPKGSPLVGDISRAILEVTEGAGMLRIQEKWFGTESKCPDPSASVSSESEKLGLNSFWSLFVIAGVAAVSALFTFAATFVYEHRNSLTSSRDDSNPSLWGKILNLLKMFDNKDLGCHTFRNERDGEVNLVNLNNNVQQESPSTYSIQSALDLDHHSVPQTPSIPPLAVHDDDITVEVNHPHPSTDSVAATLHTTSPRVDLSK